MSQNIIQKINEICPNPSNGRHSYFQLQFFVIGKQPTLQAKIRTCKVELLARKNEIEAVIVSIDDLLDRIKLEELAIEKNKRLVYAAATEEIAIETRQHERKKVSLEHQVNELKNTLTAKEEESMFLIGLYEKLIAVEAEKDWDSLEVQAEYWNAKLTREIETRLMLGELPNVEDIKTVLSLPNGLPIKNATLQLVQQREKVAKGIIPNKETVSDNT